QFISKVIDPKRRLAIVTGAASGLGFELALLLAKDNYDLFLVDVDAEKLQQAKEEITALYPSEIQLLHKDLSQQNVSEEIFQALDGRTIDVLINNAGFGIFGSFNDTDWERDAAMLNLHVMTTTHLTKLVLKGMVAR